MYLPGKEQATIEDSKIKEYLLNAGHSDGGSKALFFIAHGFQIENSIVFKNALKLHAFTHEVCNVIHTEFGIKYIVEGKINTPRQTKINIRTVWMVTLLSKIPRLVTAYPIKL